MTGGAVEYRVRSQLVAALAVASAGTTFLAARTNGVGRLFLVVVAVGAAVEALRGLRPTLVADAAGFEAVLGVRRVRHAWSEVETVGALRPPESGKRARRRANALEIDLGERLLVVPGYRLGAPVDDVAGALSALSMPNS